MATSQRYTVLMASLTFLYTAAAQSQSNFNGYFEPAVELSYQVSSTYSHSFALENRNIIYRDHKVGYTIKQIDISHFSEYQWNAAYAVGLGVQYRLENTFDPDEENELRLQQQMVYTPETLTFKVSHRFRTEQRFYVSVTKHRFRYQLGYAIPMAQNHPLRPYVKLETESLLEVAKIQKPELEQRFGVGFGWLLTPKSTFKMGVEYQLADYVQDLNHELFLLAEFGIKL